MRWKDLNSIFRQVSLTHSPRPARAINDFTVSTFILVLPTSVVDISRGIIYRSPFVLIQSAVVNNLPEADVHNDGIEGELSFINTEHDRLCRKPTERCSSCARGQLHQMFFEHKLTICASSFFASISSSLSEEEV